MTEEKGKHITGHIRTLGGVVIEMGRVYRRARRGDIDTVETGRLDDMLTQMMDDGIALCGGCHEVGHAQAA